MSYNMICLGLTLFDKASMQYTQSNIRQFLVTWMNIQAKKAKKLVSIGIGPDALLSATMALEVVEWAKHKLSDLEHYQTSILEKVAFYIECERVRAHAGWLLDDNNTHTGQYHRLKEQKKVLMQMMAKAGLEYQSFDEIKSRSLSSREQKHWYDSLLIAHTILDLAFVLIDNPDSTALDDQGLGHGLVIMKRHAQNPEGRYAKNGDVYQNMLMLKRCIEPHIKAVQKSTSVTIRDKCFSLGDESSPLKKIIKKVADENYTWLCDYQQAHQVSSTHYRIGQMPDFFAESKRKQECASMVSMWAVGLLGLCLVSYMSRQSSSTFNL